MEPDVQLTEEQLQQIQQDAALREGCEDLFMAAHQMSIMENKEAPDTEEELKINWKRVAITSMFGFGFVGPVGHFWWVFPILFSLFGHFG